MAGVILTNPKSTPTTVTDDWQTLLARDAAGAIGMNSISLTNWDATTTKPAIAAGSKIEIGGSIAQFTAEEVIGGAPADGTVYLRFIVSGSSVTAELTATAPTWNPGNNGWYSGIQRYSGHSMIKAGTSYSRKYILSPPGLENNYAIGFYETQSAPFGVARIAHSLYYGTMSAAGNKQWPLNIDAVRVLACNAMVMESVSGIWFDLFSSNWGGQLYVDTPSNTLTAITTRDLFKGQAIRVMVTHYI